jgi:FtsZ-binding cell division protein ZapB
MQDHNVLKLNFQLALERIKLLEGLMQTHNELMHTHSELLHQHNELLHQHNELKSNHQSALGRIESLEERLANQIA